MRSDALLRRRRALRERGSEPSTHRDDPDRDPHSRTRAKLARNNPDPTRRTTASATSAITSAARRAFVRGCTVTGALPLVERTATVGRENCTTGARPKPMPVTIARIRRHRQHPHVDGDGGGAGHLRRYRGSQGVDSPPGHDGAKLPRPSGTSIRLSSSRTVTSPTATRRARPEFRARVCESSRARA